MDTHQLIKILKGKPNVEISCIVCNKTTGGLMVVDLGPVDPNDMQKVWKLFSDSAKAKKNLEEDE